MEIKIPLTEAAKLARLNGYYGVNAPAFGTTSRGGISDFLCTLSAHIGTVVVIYADDTRKPTVFKDGLFVIEEGMPNAGIEGVI